MKIFNLNILELVQGWMFLWSFIPEVTLVLLVIAIVNYFNWHIFDFSGISIYSLEDADATRSQIVLILTGFLLLVLIFQFMLNFNLLYSCSSSIFKEISALIIPLHLVSLCKTLPFHNSL